MASLITRSLYPITLDRRYFVVRGRLWRMANPEQSEIERTRLVADLIRARQGVGKAMRLKDADTEQRARRGVDAAKRGLGERGPPWWIDGAPDYNRRMVRNTPYARCSSLRHIGFNARAERTTPMTRRQFARPLRSHT